MACPNMAVEMGAKVGLVSPLGLKGYDFDPQELLPDSGASYFREVIVDAQHLRSKISYPPCPDLVNLVSDAQGTPIQYGFIGSCVNGRLEDLQQAARILKGKKIADGVRLVIAPASKKVFLDAMRDGTALTLMEAGATFISSGCGPCVGTHQGVPSNQETVISTANRNFKGRMGNPQANVYLSSPAVVAKSVLHGYITE